MSNFLKAARAEVKMELATLGDNQIYEFIPERPSTPCFVLSPGSPYIQQGQAFTDFAVRFDVLVLSGKATNEVETDTLDSLIVDAIDALETWFIEDVETPSQFEINGALYLGTKISITADKTL